ncbi:MAG: AI-2E family transporter [Pararhodobacter sp.]
MTTTLPDAPPELPPEPTPQAGTALAAAQADPLRRLVAVTLGLILAILIGWLLLIGRGFLMPIVIAVLSVYVITSASNVMGRWQATAWMPPFLRKALLVLGFLAILAGFNWVVILTAQDLVALAPGYQENLENLIRNGMAPFGIAANPDWQTINSFLASRIDMEQAIGFLAGSLGGMVAVLVLAAVYAIFLAAEAGGLSRKIAVAIPDERQARHVLDILQSVNEHIGEYLAVKTLINVIIGGISYAILWAFGVDHALFWALIIAILNYIPYFGSLVAVMFPVVMMLVQSGSMALTVAVAGCLTAAQMWVGNWLEPRMIGRRVNMSPFVVVAALSFWSAFWGVAGAILAVPMTSVLMILLAEFRQTRPLAVMLANDVSAYERRGSAGTGQGAAG